MQLNINILDHKAALFIEMLQSLDFVVSVETIEEEERLIIIELRLRKLMKFYTNNPLILTKLESNIFSKLLLSSILESTPKTPLKYFFAVKRK